MRARMGIKAKLREFSAQELKPEPPQKPDDLPPWNEWLNRERAIQQRELELYRGRVEPETARNIREKAEAEIDGRVPHYVAGVPRG